MCSQEPHFDWCNESVNFNKLLHSAALENDVTTINALLTMNIDVNVKNEFGQTALHISAFNNENDSHFEAMEMLIKNGADVNSKDEYEKTPLHYLVRQANNVNAVRLLLKFKVDVDCAEDSILQTLLYSAVGNSKNIEVVRILIEHGANVNVSYDLSLKQTPLHHACQRNRGNKITKLLLSVGADIETRDSQGRTPLFYLFSSPYFTPVDNTIFILNHSNVNVVDFKGHNILTHFGTTELQFKIVLQHLAKLQALEITVHPSLLETIHRTPEMKEYLMKCSNELLRARSAKLNGSLITYFHLLIGTRRNLKNYAGNPDLVEYFNSNSNFEKFPVYGHCMAKKVKKGSKTRKLYDESAVLLSTSLPILNPTHLVIRDILDCLSTKDLSKFRED